MAAVALGPRGVGACSGAGGASPVLLPQGCLCPAPALAIRLSSQVAVNSLRCRCGERGGVGWHSPALCAGRTALLVCGCLCNLRGEGGKRLCPEQMGLFNTNGLI